MIPHPPGALLAGAPLARLFSSPLETAAWIALVLALSALLSAMRTALQHSVPARVLARCSDARRRQRLAPLLDRAEALAASAAICKIGCDVVFVGLLIALEAGDAAVEWRDVLVNLAIAAPALLLITEALPASIARARGDGLLVALLPTFRLVQLPVVPVVWTLGALRRAVLRTMHIRDDFSTRRIVEGLREVIAGADRSGDLAEAERELIENVMDFGDVDAAEVMTPRTEMHAVDVEQPLEEVLQLFAHVGHSRLPVYEESIDTIIGTVSALEAVQVVAKGELASRPLRDILRPPYLVPETKRVSELLTEFRTGKQKMAIVLDEYGGTAGLVTLGDVVEEIVGEIQDEYGESEEPMREVGEGRVEVQAGLHVSEVNEALGLDIPEEQDFETLGGFVLAELGRFPKAGESFRVGGVSFSVVEASDRRILRVLVNRSA